MVSLNHRYDQPNRHHDSLLSYSVANSTSSCHLHHPALFTCGFSICSNNCQTAVNCPNASSFAPILRSEAITVRIPRYVSHHRARRPGWLISKARLVELLLILVAAVAYSATAAEWGVNYNSLVESATTIASVLGVMYSIYPLLSLCASIVLLVRALKGMQDHGKAGAWIKSSQKSSFKSSSVQGSGFSRLCSSSIELQLMYAPTGDQIRVTNAVDLMPMDTISKQEKDDFA